ncbi:MAG: acid phosphatase [Candidatus Eremiobacteraeota bacterium]|nr:acid phosphatase [Candidatus Eremiobacteraeota bacterium]
MSAVRFARMVAVVLTAAFSGCAASPSLGPVASALSARSGAMSSLPHVAQVTVVVMENKDYDRIIGSAEAPYINKTLIPSGALLTNSHAVGHPSEPNYLALFSGSTHGIHGDPCPTTFPGSNVAVELIAAGDTFGGYSESMPHDGYTGCYHRGYARKHSPWVDFPNVPSSDNLVYRGFPQSPPTLTWITPNLCNDMHDCHIVHGDNWLSKHLPHIIAWDQQHNGLLIVTFDEAAPDRDHTNNIATILVGPMVAAGSTNDQNLTHYAVLHTIEALFTLPCIKYDCSAPLITGIWQQIS